MNLKSKPILRKDRKMSDFFKWYEKEKDVFESNHNCDDMQRAWEAALKCNNFWILNSEIKPSDDVCCFVRIAGERSKSLIRGFDYSIGHFNGEKWIVTGGIPSDYIVTHWAEIKHPKPIL